MIGWGCPDLAFGGMVDTGWGQYLKNNKIEKSTFVYGMSEAITVLMHRMTSGQPVVNFLGELRHIGAVSGHYFGTMLHFLSLTDPLFTDWLTACGMCLLACWTRQKCWVLMGCGGSHALVVPFKKKKKCLHGY